MVPRRGGTRCFVIKTTAKGKLNTQNQKLTPADIRATAERIGVAGNSLLQSCFLPVTDRGSRMSLEARRPNPRVQRTRSSPSALHEPLTRYPLGRARRRRPLDDFCKLASRGSGGNQGAEEQIESNSRVGSFHLRDTGLARADEFGESSLGQFAGLSAQTQTLGERKPELNEFGFLFGESQELAGRANLPSRGLEFLSLRAFHRSPHVFVVVPHAALTAFNNGSGRRGGFLVEDLEDQDEVRIDSVNDTPRVISIPDPKLVATRADRGHGTRVREADPVTSLKSPQEISGFDSRIGRERRSLDFTF